jgi:hypothetical protein
LRTGDYRPLLVRRTSGFQIDTATDFLRHRPALERGRVLRHAPGRPHCRLNAMQYLLLVHVDDTLAAALPDGEYDSMMRSCFVHADELRDSGHLLQSQQLHAPKTARSVRIRNGRTSVVDGPFAETKEMLGGFNLIEAADMEEAVRIAAEFPWARVGCIEVREVSDIDAERRRVAGASPMPSVAGAR